MTKDEFIGTLVKIHYMNKYSFFIITWCDFGTSYIRLIVEHVTNNQSEYFRLSKSSLGRFKNGGACATIGSTLNNNPFIQLATELENILYL